MTDEERREYRLKFKKQMEEFQLLAIEQGLIADFLGWEKSYCRVSYCTPYEDASYCNGEPTHICEPERLKFKTSWDWLIPVINKIHSSDEYIEYKNTLSQFNPGVEVNTKYIEVTYDSVLKYINWFNSRKENKS